MSILSIVQPASRKVLPIEAPATIVACSSATASSMTGGYVTTANVRVIRSSPVPEYRSVTRSESVWLSTTGDHEGSADQCLSERTARYGAAG